jgi:hypothetical protein
MTEAAATPAPGASDLINNSGAAAAKSPPALAWQPTAPPGYDAPEAVSARAEIETLKADKTFYKSLLEEKEKGITGPANQKWADLHKRGWPLPTGIASESDANAEASARNEKEWSTFIAALGTQWQITPEQIAELRSGVIREDLHKLALQQRDLMVRDKIFYRKLLDGDMAAKEKWQRVIAAISLRPVKAA